MHGLQILQNVYMILQEPEKLDNPTYDLGGVCATLNMAQRKVAEYMRQLDAGYWEIDLTVTIPVGATGYYFPFYMHSLRAVSIQGGPIIWENDTSQQRAGRIRFGHDGLTWQDALTAEQTWTIRMVRLPLEARFGVLPAQTGGDASNVVLPTPNYSESLVMNNYAAAGVVHGTSWMSFGIIEEDSLAQQELVESYASATKILTLEGALPTAPALGDRFLLMETWPELWGDLLAYETAKMLPDGLQLAAEGWKSAYNTAIQAGAKRQSFHNRQVRYDPRN